MLQMIIFLSIYQKSTVHVLEIKDRHYRKTSNIIMDYMNVYYKELHAVCFYAGDKKIIFT